MNLQQYRERRQQLSEQEPTFRDLCLQCRQPGFGCFCAHIQPVDCKIKFVILIHPIEIRRRIATGRMAHLSLHNSHLIPGCNYSNTAEVNGLISNPDNHCVILYPGERSTNLTPLTPTHQKALFPIEKQLVVFVIDGTWGTARQMVRLSENLHTLERICFSPPKPSNFRVRKQPAPECYSTIEAIHHTIELLGESQGFATAQREHDSLITVFDWMVERQLEFIKASRGQGPSRYRREYLKRTAV